MLKNRTVIILDRSGSMETCRNGTVKGFNEQVQEAKKVKADLDVDVGLVQFNGQVEFTLWGRKPEQIDELRIEDYRPNGSTALYDAVGFSVDRLLDEAKNYPADTSYLVIIISDGEENSSKTVSKAKLAERIQELQNTKNWTFTYAGANFDLTKIHEDLFIPTANIMKFAADEVGVLVSNKARMRSTEGYYSNAARGMAGAMAMNFYSPTDQITDLTQQAPDPVDEKAAKDALDSLTDAAKKGKKSDTGAKKA